MILHHTITSQDAKQFDKAVEKFNNENMVLKIEYSTSVVAMQGQSIPGIQHQVQVQLVPIFFAFFHYQQNEATNGKPESLAIVKKLKFKYYATQSTQHC
jgi:hypothetical protein